MGMHALCQWLPPQHVRQLAYWLRMGMHPLCQWLAPQHDRQLAYWLRMGMHPLCQWLAPQHVRQRWPAGRLRQARAMAGTAITTPTWASVRPTEEA